MSQDKGDIRPLPTDQNKRDIKMTLAEKVEFLTDKGTTQKQRKCQRCDKGFLGRDGANACSPACKKALQRG